MKKKIIIFYNGDKNLPLERNHKTTCGKHQLSKEFDNLDMAITFWLECDFYSGSITSLNEILPKDYNHQLLSVLQEETFFEELQLDSQYELYNTIGDEDFPL